MTSMSATSFAKDVATVSIDGGEVMTFGPTTDTPSPNKFTLVVTDKDGKTICEDGLRLRCSTSIPATWSSWATMVPTA